MPPPRQKNWLMSSPEYREFADICEKAKWHTKIHLPTAGAQAASSSGLTAFILKGLAGNVDGEGKQRPFSRAQINKKFADWQSSLEREKDHAEIFSTQIASTSELLQALKSTAFYKCNATELFVESSEEFFWKDIVESKEGTESLDLLRNKLLECVNHTLLSTMKLAKVHADRYQDDASKICKWYYSEIFPNVVEAIFLGAGNMSEDIRESVEAFGCMLAHEFKRVFHMSMRRGNEESLQSRVDKILAQLPRGGRLENILPDDPILKNTWYYVASWLILAAEKRLKCGANSVKPTLTELLKTAEASQAELAILPTGKVDKAEIHEGRMKRASRSFFHFVAVVEKVCEQLLVMQTIKIEGPQFIRPFCRILCMHSTIQNQLKECCPSVEHGGIVELAELLIRTYMQMRGKDFVRKIMGVTSLAVGTRTNLKAITTYTRESKSNGGGPQQKKPRPAMQCYFCGEMNHLPAFCPMAKIPPAAGSSSSMKVKQWNGEEREWHWCTKCKRWVCHTTDEHIGEEDEMAALIDEVVGEDENEEETSGI
jgi:hypothetical protein